MKTGWTILVAALLSACADPVAHTPDPKAEALRLLRESGDNDAFLIVTNGTGDRQYLQFTLEGGQLVFDRPVLVASLPQESATAARSYHPVETRPVIEGAVITEFLDGVEADRARQVFARWGLSGETSFAAALDDDGRPVEYIEGLGGPFTVPDAEFDAFLVEFFTEVFQLAPAALTLAIETDAG